MVERLGFWRVERLGSVRKVPSAYQLSKVGRYRNLNAINSEALQ